MKLESIVLTCEDCLCDICCLDCGGGPINDKSFFRLIEAAVAVAEHVERIVDCDKEGFVDGEFQVLTTAPTKDEVIELLLALRELCE